MRLIGLLLLAVVAAIVLWLVFLNPRRGGDRAAPVAGSPAVGRPAATPHSANSVVKTQMADEAARQAQAAAKAKAAEAAQADELERNMTPAQNRLNEDYAAQVGDTRPAAAGAGDNTTGPDAPRP